MNANRQISCTLLLDLTAVLLPACPSKSIKKPQTGTTIPAVKGPDRPTGTLYPPGTTVIPGGGANYAVVRHGDLSRWATQHPVQNLRSSKPGCGKLKNCEGWQDVYTQAAQTSEHHFPAEAFFKEYFIPWQVSANGPQAGTVTGYYEPVLHSDVRQTAKVKSPVYGIPHDSVSIPLPANLCGSKSTVRVRTTGRNSGMIDEAGQYATDLSQFPITARITVFKGRFIGDHFPPYHSRNQINGGALNGRTLIPGRVDSPVELLFMQAQGSGRLKTPSGKYIRLGYADRNKQPYVSIGHYMADRGYFPLGQTTMQGIKAYMQQNPQRLAEVLGQNLGYIFLRELLGDGDEGPLSVLGTPLLDEYADTVNRHYIILGAPLFVAIAYPLTGHALSRLITMQDTGSITKGVVRVDYFWGHGGKAGEATGEMKAKGYAWLLLPNGVQPEHRP